MSWTKEKQKEYMETYMKTEKYKNVFSEKIKENNKPI